MSYYLYILTIFLLLISESCDYCKAWGSENIGNGLVIFEDIKEDKVIILCTSKTLCCSSGLNILPTYDQHMTEDGLYDTYLKDVAFDDNWIIAESYSIVRNEIAYWAISKDFSLDSVDCNSIRCDSLVRLNLFGPFSDEEVYPKLAGLEIDSSLIAEMFEGY